MRISSDSPCQTCKARRHRHTQSLHTHRHTQTHTHTQTHAHVHHAHAHARTHTHAHARTRTHAHTLTLATPEKSYSLSLVPPVLLEVAPTFRIDLGLTVGCLAVSARAGGSGPDDEGAALITAVAFEASQRGARARAATSRSSILHPIQVSARPTFAPTGLWLPVN